jgi:hypothetical protein
MSDERPFHPEQLRPVNYVCAPDPRSIGFVTTDRETGSWRPLQISDYYLAVSSYCLNEAVPEDIRVHFDTARNLYLYAFYVYRFYPVSEHHALACLELALRDRYEKEIPKKYYARSRFVTLKPLLQYAVDKGEVKNEGFKRWRESAEIRARSRYSMEKLEEMRDKGMDRIDLDYSEAKVTDIDRNQAYVVDLVKILPKLRNNYAHGSGILHSSVLGTIQIVSEIINQVYPETGNADE